MSVESPTPQSAELRVLLFGDAPHTDDVRRQLAADARIVVSRPDDANPAAAEADCLVCTTVDAVSRLETRPDETPVVVVLSELDERASETAYRAGATDVLTPTETLPNRVAWLSGDDSVGDGARTARSDLADAAVAFDDAACVLDRRWRVERATDALGAIVGATPAVLEGRNLWAVCPVIRPLKASCWQAILSGETVRFEETLANGRRVEVNAVPSSGGLVLRCRDITARTETRERLDRYQRVLETIDDGIYILDGNFQITEVNEAVLDMTGYDRDTLEGAHSTILADESVLTEAGEVIQDILIGERSTGRLDVELERADGGTIPVETRFSALQFSDGSHGSVGVIRDIRDRKRYERTLTALNRSARELFESQTKPAVAETILDTATQILELESVVVYLYDESAGELRPVAWEGSGSPPAVGPGDGVLWDCFVDGESIPLATDEPSLDEWDRLSSDPDREDSVAIPLGEHGVLATVSTGTDTPRGQSTLTYLLSANATAALDRVARSVELERRGEELARRNEELTSLNRFNELLREVNRVLVEADSREEIERAVCERLVDGPTIAFAWIGSYDRVEESVVPRAWAGTERGYLDRLTDAQEGFTDEPSVRTVQSGETTLVDNVGSDIQRHPWRRDALDRGFASVASVPLSYHEYGYGALTVYATEPNAFDERTRLMFEELGVTTANAINGAEAKESLHTESLVELDVRVTSTNAPLLRISQALGGSIRLEGSIPQSGGSTLLYLTITDPEIDPERLSSLTAVERVREIAAPDEETLVEVEVATETLPSRLADLGAAVKTLTADTDALDVVVELPAGSDVRDFVEALQEAFPGTELSAKRTRERSLETAQSFRAGFQESLTDRQFEALRTAYFSGYFRWPRDRTASQLADSLDIAQPTFARHLRIAERKLLDALLAKDEPVRR